jgi:hypothetical protein
MERIIKTGELFLMTTGQYSDYDVKVLCRANTNINTSAVVDEYLVDHPEEAQDYHFGEFAFINWVINETKKADEVTAWEWHFSAYDTAYRASGLHKVELDE